MSLLIKNIKGLVQVENEIRPCVKGADMSILPTIENAYLLMKGDKIAAFGEMKDCPASADEVIDATGKFVFPSFCDSHTHIVYAGSREIEFLDKINGLSYEEIFERGGGILNSARRLHDTSEEELYEQAKKRIYEMISYGTGACDIKSGYGLSTEDELKMLRVICRLKETTPMTIRANFLCAHALPLEYKGRQGEFVDLVCKEMIPAVAAEGLAEFIDVFCEKGFFTVEETDRILKTAAQYGIRPKIHGNQLAVSGGVQVAVENNAVSVDHLEETTSVEIECLRDSNTIPTALPGCSFYLGIPFAPAKQMIAAGLPLALASDYNPGSTPSGNMKFIVSLACIKMKLTPAQAFNATTINTAAAMDIAYTHGSIAIGKHANVFITKVIPSIEFMPYAYTMDTIETTILNGKVVNGEA